jgi:uncharacterized protein YdeI (YjbR/CyaY-like superfamily)
MTTTLDVYLSDGCGRCAYFATPACKVRQWQAELQALRQLVLSAGLTEEMKWGVPCYTFGGKNVLLLSALKECCVLSFFKGEGIADACGLLEKPGPNSQAARVLRVTSVEQITANSPAILDCIAQALELEKAGTRVALTPNPEPFPEEWVQAMDANPVLKQAFLALTPGRQRGYVLYFSQPKQPKTRLARIEKCQSRILRGEGLHDRP